jgi:hypothetical protein
MPVADGVADIPLPEIVVELTPLVLSAFTVREVLLILTLVGE